MSNRRNGQSQEALRMANAPRLEPVVGPPKMHADPAAFEADFQPMANMVLIRILETRTTAGGLALPKGSTDGSPPRAQIIKVGPGMMNYREKLFTRCPMDPEIRPGRVIYPILHPGGQSATMYVGDEKYMCVTADSIIGCSGAPPEPLAK